MSPDACGGRLEERTLQEEDTKVTCFSQFLTVYNSGFCWTINGSNVESQEFHSSLSLGFFSYQVYDRNFSNTHR